VQGFIFSVLKNLISNAIKYRDDERALQIELESKRENDKVLVTVKDNGIGIDLKKYGDRLFKVFSRLTDRADGTGIGLYIVRNLVEGNGGSIKVESEPGKGTTFYCYLKEY
jgi:signal transduction histidine kinase